MTEQKTEQKPDHEKRIREAVVSGENFSDNDLRALLADLDRLRDNLDAMRGALEKISGLGMSQFFKPYDMAEEAQNIARTALKGASHE